MPAPALVEIPKPRPSAINWDAIGAFFWNPHPPGPAGASSPIGGLRYPYGTQGVIVCGKHYVCGPQSTLSIPPDDPNFNLVIRNLMILCGDQSRNDMGMRRIYLEILDTEGSAYLERLDREGANVILETVKRNVIEALDKENESRATRHIPKRLFDANEQRMLTMIEGLAERLDKQKFHDLKTELKGIKEKAQIVPEFEKELSALPMGKLRHKAKVAGILYAQNITQPDLIRLLQEHKAAQLQDTNVDKDPDVIANRAAMAAGQEEIQAEAGAGDEDEDEILNDTVSVDEQDGLQPTPI